MRSGRTQMVWAWMKIYPRRYCHLSAACMMMWGWAWKLIVKL